MLFRLRGGYCRSAVSSHHVDNAHRAMNTEYSGPVQVWGTAEFPTNGLWDVHGKFLTHAIYANGATTDILGDFPNGIKFYGSKGWVFASRGTETVTASDPAAKLKDATALAAEENRFINGQILAVEGGYLASGVNFQFTYEDYRCTSGRLFPRSKLCNVEDRDRSRNLRAW